MPKPKNGSAGASNGRPKPKKRVVPTDDVSFAALVRGLNRSITRLKRHLSVTNNSRDYRSRRRMEYLIDFRGGLLVNPPESVSPEIVESLRREVSCGVTV